MFLVILIFDEVLKKQLEEHPKDKGMTTLFSPMFAQAIIWTFFFDSKTDLFKNPKTKTIYVPQKISLWLSYK